MANRFTDPRPQFLDISGRVLNGGKLYFYLTASSTPATTYSDRTLTTPNSNPVVLLSDGRPATDIFLDPAVTYKVVLTNATGSTTFWTADPVVDPAAGVTAVIQVYNGDPNGHVAGNAGSVGGSGASMVYDITNRLLYICTTTGTTLTAVWTPVRDSISGQEDVRTADYTILAADHGRTQVANKASAITFSLTAAATLGAGFVVPIKNIGAGALTIDPNSSELIDGQSTITLGQHEGVVLYCTGSAWRTLGRAAKPPKGYLYGLTLANNVTDATNDIDIAAGEAADANGLAMMALASGLTKQLDAAWAVGTNQGMRDTGSIANGWWYIYLIRRSDTGVVDVLASTSASAPTMPTNYDQKRRIGAIFRSGGALVAFIQRDDHFVWKVPVFDLAASPGGTSAQTLTLTIPVVQVEADVVFTLEDGTGSGITYELVTAIDQTDSTPSGSLFTLKADANAVYASVRERIPSSTGTCRWRVSRTGASINVFALTQGWFDARGRLS